MGCRRVLHEIIDGTERKRCGRCAHWLALEHFSKSRAAWDGPRESIVKHRACDRVASTDWFHGNREQHYEKTRWWVQAHPERRSEIRKRWTANIDYYRQWRTLTGSEPLMPRGTQQIASVPQHAVGRGVR